MSATQALACTPPPAMREATSIHGKVATAVQKSLKARPQKPSSSTGVWPNLSESATGATPRALVT